MFEEKCDAIERYLRQFYENSHIEQANISDDQHFRIPVENGLLMLRIDRNFIDDNSKEEILGKLENWNIIGLLNDNKKLGIFVSDSGPCTYQRS